MSDKTYNGWTNYATWRVNLEIFDGVDLKNICMFYKASPNAYDISQQLKDYAEEIIFLDSHIGNKTPSSLLEDYARAFLEDVNWKEIAEHMIADYVEAAE
jgi:hypothetical protein